MFDADMDKLWTNRAKGKSGSVYPSYEGGRGDRGITGKAVDETLALLATMHYSVIYPTTMTRVLYRTPQRRSRTMDRMQRSGPISFKGNGKMGATKVEPTYPDALLRLERNTAILKDFKRLAPTAITIACSVNGHEVRALIDSGSLSDFVSTTVVDQLKLAAICLNL